MDKITVTQAEAYLYENEEGSRELIFDASGERARRLIELGYTETPLFASQTDAQMAAASLSASNVMRDALTVARNRLQSLAARAPFNSSEGYDASKWAAEATAALSQRPVESQGTTPDTVEQAVAAERERCANIAESCQEINRAVTNEVANRIARRIRAKDKTDA